MDFGILKIIGIILFLYLTWRNLREDYKEGELIAYGWLTVLSFFVGSRLMYGLINWGEWNSSIWDWFSFIDKPGMNYLGGYGLVLISSYFFGKYYGWKLWSLGEDIITSFIVLLLFFVADDLSRLGLDLKIIVYFIILLFGLIVSLLVKKKYRSFIWYKSGKKGFVFLLANFVMWLLLGISSIWFKFGLIYSISYLVIGLIFLVGLGILGNE